ncbi:enoyl-CoA hydratase-related protein [Ramlibacter sp.]|uniref:enoyl-CoA hydratase/isomerase family protein n=1 Tax=Ramlibacter sp. TaxID=1917967 RepID=UPI002610AD06|nr:enoyl-CoA hydratase-related protein [Ramlibacter sp.]MDB5957479.1 enoyl-CoA hydratase [Ramlibacter sp.]
MNFPGYDTVQVVPHDEHVLLATLNRPPVLNALNTQMGRDLFDLFSRLTADAGGVRCVVLTGAGKAFCAGGDLKERDGMTRAQWQAQHELFERAFVALLECPTPVVAAVNGPAFGGGFEMALCCDFLYAAASAKFALPEVKLGIMPGGCGTQNLARAVGERRAKELVLTGRAFTAQEALAWGAVNQVCAPDALLPDALATARAIADNAPLSVRQARKSIHYGLQVDLLTGYRFEIEAYNRLVDTEDRHEGVRAFNEKRKPDFQGR